MMIEKKYLEVVATFTTDGAIIPKSVVFNDKRYKIDRVLDVRPAASLKCGGYGTRYICRIAGKELILFLEESRWFAEN